MIVTERKRRGKFEIKLCGAACKIKSRRDVLSTAFVRLNARASLIGLS